MFLLASDEGHEKDPNSYGSSSLGTTKLLPAILREGFDDQGGAGTSLRAHVGSVDLVTPCEGVFGHHFGLEGEAEGILYLKKKYFIIVT